MHDKNKQYRKILREIRIEQEEEFGKHRSKVIESRKSSRQERKDVRRKLKQIDSSNYEDYYDE